MRKTVLVGMIAGFASGIHIDTKTTEEKGCCDSGEPTNLRGVASPPSATVAESVQPEPTAPSKKGKVTTKTVSEVDKKWGAAYLIGGTMLAAGGALITMKSTSYGPYTVLFLFLCAAMLFVLGLKRIRGWSETQTPNCLMKCLGCTAGMLSPCVLCNWLCVIGVLKSTNDEGSAFLEV